MALPFGPGDLAGSTVLKVSGEDTRMPSGTPSKPQLEMRSCRPLGFWHENIPSAIDRCRPVSTVVPRRCHAEAKAEGLTA